MTKEDTILAKCHTWLWNTYPKLRFLSWHVENERKRNPVQQGIAKAKGVVPGVPDYVFNYKGKVYYIEFKTIIGKQSESQILMQKQLEDNGFEYVIIRDVETFKQYINNIVISNI